MTTNWALPTMIDQYAEESAENVHVSWLEIDNFEGIKFKDGRKIKTARDLLHIARDPKNDIKEKTYFLKITGFQFENLPETITGIECKLTMNRFGRITDDTVQLVLNNELIGNNKADLELDPIKIYGKENDVWGTSVTSSDVQNSSFGVVIRFQSHPNWPHKCTPFIDAVELRIH